VSHAGGSPAYACGRAARWLPRVAAGAVLVAGLLAAAHIDPERGVAGARSVRALVAVVGAIGSLWVLRRGAEVRLRVSVGPEAVAFEANGRSAELPIDEIDAIRYEGPFGVSRYWLPAAILVDRQGREWRISGLLQAGDRLIAEIVDRGRREALATWVCEQRIGERMAHAPRRVGVGYGVALAIVVLSVLTHLR